MSAFTVLPAPDHVVPYRLPGRPALRIKRVPWNKRLRERPMIGPSRRLAPLRCQCVRGIRARTDLFPELYAALTNETLLPDQRGQLSPVDCRTVKSTSLIPGQ